MKKQKTFFIFLKTGYKGYKS